MGNINLEGLDNEYRRILAMGATVNHALDHFTGYPHEQWQNPYNDVKRSHEQMVAELKKDLEAYLSRLYREKFCGSMEHPHIRGHENWFTVENFSCTAFIKKIHEIMAENVDKLTLDNMIGKAKEILPSCRFYGEDKNFSESDISGMKNILQAHCYPDHWKHDGSYELRSEQRHELYCLWWLASFLEQVPIGAEPPSTFTPRQFPYRLFEKLPVDHFFPVGPWWQIQIYKNGKIIIKFRTPDLLKKTLMAIFHGKIDLIYKKTEIDFHSVFEEETGEVKRIVRMGR